MKYLGDDYLGAGVKSKPKRNRHRAVHIMIEIAKCFGRGCIRLAKGFTSKDAKKKYSGAWKAYQGIASRMDVQLGSFGGDEPRRRQDNSHHQEQGFFDDDLILGKRRK